MRWASKGVLETRQKKHWNGHFSEVGVAGMLESSDCNAADIFFPFLCEVVDKGFCLNEMYIYRKCVHTLLQFGQTCPSNKT